MAEVAHIHHRSTALHQRLWQHIGETTLPSDTRCRFAAGSFSHVMECHRAMILLTRERLHGPSFALVRVICEALATGSWSYWCAKDERLCQIENDPAKYDFGKNMLNEIKRCRKFSDGRYLHLKEFLSYHMGSPGNHADQALHAKSKSIWKAMNSFSHGSYWQIVNYQSEEAIEPNFDDDVVGEVMRFADCCACWAAIGVSEIAGQVNVAEEIYSDLLVAT